MSTQIQTKLYSTGWGRDVAILSVIIFLTGLASAQLIIKHDLATPIYLASGIALAAFLISGYRMWPGVVVGHFPINIYVIGSSGSLESLSISTSVLVLSTIFTLGFLLEIFIAASLIRRFLNNENYLDTEWNIFLFMLFGCVSCLVSPFVANMAQLYAGLISEISLNMFLSWWASDALGIILVTPIILLWKQAPGSSLRFQRKIMITTPLCALVLILIFLTVYSRQVEEQKYELKSAAANNEMTQVIEQRITSYLNAALTVGTFLNGQQSVSEENFETVKKYINDHYLEFKALTWIPLVKHEDRDKYESEIKMQTHVPGQIVELNDDLKLVEASVRDIYAPLHYYYPQDLYTNFRSIDLLARSNTGDILRKSVQTGAPVISPILPSTIGKEKIILITTSVYKTSVIPETEEARWNQLIGFITTRVTVPDLLGIDTKYFQHTTFQLYESLLPVPDNLIFNTQGKNIKAQSLSQLREIALHIDLQDWLLTYQKLEADIFPERDWTRSIIIISSLIISLLFTMTLLIITTRNLKLHRADDKIRDLSKKQEQSLRTLELTHSKLQKQQKLVSDLFTKVLSNPESNEGWLACILESICTHLDIDRLSIWRLTENNQTLSCTDFYDSSDHLKTHPMMLDRENYPIIIGGIESGQIFEIEDVYNHPITSEIIETTLEPIGAQSMLLVPLVVHGRTLGTLCHTSIREKIRWKADQILFAQTISSMISLLLEKNEHEKMTRKLIKTQKMEAVGQLSGSIAHDFNNLLAIMMGASDAAIEKINGAKDDRLTNYLTEINRAAQRGSRLTRQLLTFSHHQKFQKKPNDLNNIIQDSLAMLERLIGRRINIVLNLDSTIGQVMSDQSGMEQIILNLVMNARDAMPESGELVITTRVAGSEELRKIGKDKHSDTDYLLFEVSDTGIGIDEEALPYILEPFYSTKQDRDSAGIGLASVNSIVREHDGFIEVHSKPNLGTTVSIYLPQLRDDILSDPEKHIVHEYRDEPHEGIILLVEDETSLRNLIKSALVSKGY